jgi:hypothetical protein
MFSEFCRPPSVLLAKEAIQGNRHVAEAQHIRGAVFRALHNHWALDDYWAVETAVIPVKTAVIGIKAAVVIAVGATEIVTVVTAIIVAATLLVYTYGGGAVSIPSISHRRRRQGRQTGYAKGRRH